MSGTLYLRTNGVKLPHKELYDCIDSYGLFQVVIEGISTHNVMAVRVGMSENSPFVKSLPIEKGLTLLGEGIPLTDLIPYLFKVSLSDGKVILTGVIQVETFNTQSRVDSFVINLGLESDVIYTEYLKDDGLIVSRAEGLAVEHPEAVVKLNHTMNTPEGLPCNVFNVVQPTTVFGLGEVSPIEVEVGEVEAAETDNQIEADLENQDFLTRLSAENGAVVARIYSPQPFDYRRYPLSEAKAAEKVGDMYVSESVLQGATYCHEEDGIFVRSDDVWVSSKQSKSLPKRIPVGGYLTVEQANPLVQTSVVQAFDNALVLGQTDPNNTLAYAEKVKLSYSTQEGLVTWELPVQDSNGILVSPLDKYDDSLLGRKLLSVVSGQHGAAFPVDVVRQEGSLELVPVSNKPKFVDQSYQEGGCVLFKHNYLGVQVSRATELTVHMVSETTEWEDSERCFKLTAPAGSSLISFSANSATVVRVKQGEEEVYRATYLPPDLLKAVSQDNGVTAMCGKVSLPVTGDHVFLPVNYPPVKDAKVSAKLPVTVLDRLEVESAESVAKVLNIHIGMQFEQPQALGELVARVFILNPHQVEATESDLVLRKAGLEEPLVGLRVPLTAEEQDITVYCDLEGYLPFRQVLKIPAIPNPPRFQATKTKINGVDLLARECEDGQFISTASGSLLYNGKVFQQEGEAASGTVVKDLVPFFNINIGDDL